MDHDLIVGTLDNPLMWFSYFLGRDEDDVAVNMTSGYHIANSYYWTYFQLKHETFHDVHAYII